jgi:uncharacterized membrane protein
MYAILLLAWVLKITSPKLQEEGVTADTARPLEIVVTNASLGPVPGWIVIAAIAVLFVALAFVSLRRKKRADDDEVHV